jgi:hypothetical protein
MPTVCLFVKAYGACFELKYPPSRPHPKKLVTTAPDDHKIAQKVNLN